MGASDFSWGVAGAGANTLFGAALSALNNWQSFQYYKKGLGLQFDYNEQAANNADKRQRNLFADLYSPMAQLQQLKHAGLSPSLMFANGTGGQGLSAPQGGGVSGLPETFGAQSGDIMSSMLASAQADLIHKQAENVEADTELKKGETELTQARVNNVVQDTNNKFLIGENQVIQNMMSQIDLALKGEYGEKRVKKELEILGYKAETMVQELRELVVKGNIAEDTQETIIKYYHERTKSIAQEVLLKITQNKLTQEQIYNLVNEQVLARGNYALKSEEIYQNFILKLKELGIQQGHLDNESTRVMLEEFRMILDACVKFDKSINPPKGLTINQNINK